MIITITYDENDCNEYYVNHIIIRPRYGKKVSDEENSDSSEGSTGSYLRTESWSWGVALDAEIIVNYQITSSGDCKEKDEKLAKSK